MTSSKPRRCLSRVVHVGLLSHGMGTFLTHRLPQRLTEPTLTQYSLFFPITTDYHLKTLTTPLSPLLAVLDVTVHPSTGIVPITVLQTHKRKYTHIAQQKKQYATNIIIIIIPPCSTRHSHVIQTPTSA